MIPHRVFSIDDLEVAMIIHFNGDDDESANTTRKGRTSVGSLGEWKEGP